jgi:hypothetical protein
MKMLASKNRPLSNKLTAVSIFFLFFLLTISSLVSSQASFSEESSSKTYTTIQMSTDNQELDLLRVEHYLYVNASADVGTFHIKFSFPPDYQYQVPFLLELHNDSTTSKILHYQIENDTCEPNKIINFTVGAMEKDDSVLIHFSCWVLVKNHDFNDLPTYVKIPKKYQLPIETKIWLSSSSQVQTHSLLIRHKAWQLHGLSDNLIHFAHRIAPFIRYHRFGLFILELRLGLLLSQDARTTLLINGENVGRSHLACAFFRIYDIPARVLLVNNDQGFWTQMHYMVEYYCPGYGWVLVETTFGKSPYSTKHQVVNRVCYPQDEENTKEDYIFPFMKGEERWLWIDTNNISPYYVDCKKGSKSQMFSEAVVSVDQLTANFAFVLTERVFRQYQSYLGLHLTDENLYHFQNATLYQKEAIITLKGNNTEGYISFLNRAYDEYNEISL